MHHEANKERTMMYGITNYTDYQEQTPRMRIATARRFIGGALLAVGLIGSSLVAAHPPQVGAVPCSICEFGDDEGEVIEVHPTLVVNGRTVIIKAAVPRAQLPLVESVSLDVVVPANTRAILGGANAAQGVSRLRFQSRLLPTGAPYGGTGPIPVIVTATVNLRPGATGAVTTGLRARQPSVGSLGETVGTAGTPMALTISVHDGP
jgi:hypothetical protein